MFINKIKKVKFNWIEKPGQLNLGLKIKERRKPEGRKK